MDDIALRQNVLDELDYEPSVHAAGIRVAVQDGVVTLTGHVPNFMEKSLADRAVRRVRGVRGIAERLKVEFGRPSPFSDDDIAKRALTVLDLNVLVPAGAVRVRVVEGALILSGVVEWEFQRAAAHRDLSKLRGVTAIADQIKVTPAFDAWDIEERIRAALQRTATGEARAIKVFVKDGQVRLEGEVPSWADRYVVERAAWSAPGVRSIDDHLTVA